MLNLPPLVLILLMACAAVLVIGLVYWISIQSREPSRTMDMRRHIASIHDPIGCDTADVHLKEVLHIMEYYGVKLPEAGYHQSLDHLRSDARASLERSRQRAARVLKIDLSKPVEDPSFREYLKKLEIKKDQCVTLTA